MQKAESLDSDNADYLTELGVAYYESGQLQPAMTALEKTLKGFYEKVPAEKVVVGLGVYSYDYGKSGARAASLTWADAITLAKQQDATIELNSARKNAHRASVARMIASESRLCGGVGTKPS